MTENVPSSSWGNTPSVPILRVRPEQITHRSFVRHFLETVEHSNIVQGLNRRRETSMQAEYLIVNEGSERQEVEKVGKVLPDIRVSVFSHAFIVKAIHLSDLPRLVVASGEVNSRRVPDLEAD